MRSATKHRNGTAAKTNGIITPAVRVAIYTRQSVTETKDAEFGSIDAQREAVEAYVTSQRARGWQALPEPFDDAGCSGANIDRPAFQRLLEQIRAGAADCVAVYKIDRLSRSLADFAALMREFDELEVTFVSTTQSFDTATVTGRLLLNILASFAEFERDTIAERTRDKVNAARRKGRWTGGQPPLGYDVIDGKLVVNEAEAERVRAIFELFLELGSLQGTVYELGHRGWTLKSWTTKEGKPRTGAAFTKTTLSAFLENAIVLGRIRAGDELVGGQHSPIVDQALFDAVGAQLEARARPGFVFRGKSEAFLRGLVKCGVCQSPMYPHYSQVHGRRQLYYVCKRIYRGNAAACPGSRVAAGALEAFVVDKIRGIARDPSIAKATVDGALKLATSREPELRETLARSEKETRRLEAEQRNLVEAIAQGNGGKAALRDKLETVERSIEATREAAARARGEIAQLKSQVIDEGDLQRAVERFDPIWDKLVPAERSRIVHLLLAAIRVNAREDAIDLDFRSDGIRALANDGTTEAA